VIVVIQTGCDWWKFSLFVMRIFREFCVSKCKIWVEVCM